MYCVGGASAISSQGWIQLTIADYTTYTVDMSKFLAANGNSFPAIATWTSSNCCLQPAEGGNNFMVLTNSAGSSYVYENSATTCCENGFAHGVGEKLYIGLACTLTTITPTSTWSLYHSCASSDNPSIYRQPIAK